MKFCPRCESMMKMKDKQYTCSCGMFEHVKEQIKLETNNKPWKELKILESEINPLAAHDHICSQCGYEKAQLVTKGIFVSDEDEMTGYICGKCGHHDPEDGLKA